MSQSYLGGGHIVPCEAKPSEKCLCSNKNNTVLIKKNLKKNLFDIAAVMIKTPSDTSNEYFSPINKD